jgi:signal transduction histidine kinase/CheY-like chemotaxis protein
VDETDILIVDDEPQLCEFLARAMTQRGLACRTAGDGEQAVDEVSRRRPSLVVTDLCMPKRDGRWLLGELKRRWPELPVIMLTGDGEAQTAVQCLKDGAEDYLVKPVNLEELWIAARRAAEKVRLLKETREQRAHLEIAQTQGERLQEAFGIIETTYRDTIGALLRAESLERSAAANLAGKHRPGETEVPGPRSTDPKPTAGMETGKAIELSGLRVAGRLIGDGAPFIDVGTAIGNELVEHDGLTCVRIWAHPEGEPDVKLLVDVGGGSIPGREQAERTISSAAIERVDSDDVTSLTCPILVNGAPRAVLQLVAPIQIGANMVQSAERLSLVLAASLAREHDIRERRRTAEELDLLYELASASRYSLDLEHVAEFLLESLDRVVDYDVASLLLIDEEASLNIQTRFPAQTDFIRRVREHVLTNLKLTCGIEPPQDLHVRVRGVDSARSRPAPAKLRSFINVPLTVGGRVAGLVYVSSGRDRAFTDGEVQFVHRAANFLATSVQGVRELVAAVKGRIEQMVDHMTDGVLMLDRRGSVVAMNGAAREALNCQDEGELPMNASRLAKLLDFDPLELMKTQRRSLRRLVCVRGVPYQAQLSPVVSDNGDMVGTVLAFRNFQQEQKLDEMKNELVNVVSHELRTPLTAIKNALSLLHGPRLGALNDKQQRFVRLAQTNVEQLVGIINDLLDLSKLEAGKMHIDLEPLSLAEPIAAALSSLEPPAEAKGVSLQSSTGNDLPLVHGDAASIQRLLINLVGNAIKFTDPGGRVLVEATTVEGESGCASGTAVRVTVSDTGVGVPKDQLESIFDKFHQVTGASRHTTTVGTGLGLPICRELIKAHHGRIWAESDEGSGSRFSFTLPLLDDYELLLRCLETDIARAGADGTSIVVTLLSVREDRSSGADPRPLDVLRDVAKSVTRRSADRVFLIRNKSQVVIILPRTPGEGGAVFGERFAAELQKANLAKEFSVDVGSSTFPDDGGSADSLYSRAEASLRESAPAEPALESETKTSTEGKRY